MSDEIEKVERALDRLPIPMPPEIAKAIIAVAKQVRQLGKNSRNEFANFGYVSVDKFYSVIGPMMADAGLFVIAEEDNCEIRAGEGKGGWLTADYAMTIYHESGAAYGPVHRRIVLSAIGPQAFGSGLSYVEKYFLRGLFKIPTGEQDADGHAQEGLPEQKAKAAREQHDQQTKQEANPAAAEKTLKVLAGASQQGMPAFEAAWKLLSPAQRRNVQAVYLDQLKMLKADAAEASKAVGNA